MARILRNWKITRPAPPGPARLGRHRGLAYALWLPSGEPEGSVLVVHGAGSTKESHFDFARAARAAGMATLVYDLRGHGDSEGSLDGRLLEDAAAMAGLLPSGPFALRGSSLGGYLALLVAPRVQARAVVAICPAGADVLLRLLRGELGFRADVRALEGFLTEHDLELAIAEVQCDLLLAHAEGDERVPVEHSRRLYAAATAPRKRLIALPGGHHRSVQHDPEMQAESLRFLRRAFSAEPPVPRPG